MTATLTAPTGFRPARAARASTGGLARAALLLAARVHAEAEEIEEARKALAAAGQHYHEAATCLREVALEVGSAACADADSLAAEVLADLAPEAPPAPVSETVSHGANGRAALERLGFPLTAAALAGRAEHAPPPDEDEEDPADDDDDHGGEGCREWPEVPLPHPADDVPVEAVSQEDDDLAKDAADDRADGTETRRWHCPECRAIHHVPSYVADDWGGVCTPCKDRGKQVPLAKGNPPLAEPLLGVPAAAGKGGKPAKATRRRKGR